MSVAECEQLIADCTKLSETMGLLAIYFTGAAHRLELGGGNDGIAENIRIVREMLTTLRCTGCCEPLGATAQSDGVPPTPSKIDGVPPTPSQSDGAAHTYTVGSMSHTARIRAPNPSAAAVFYGTLIAGNALFAAVVYAVDGVEYTGDAVPMMDVQLGKRNLPPEELRKIRGDLRDCEVVEWGGSLAVTPQ